MGGIAAQVKQEGGEIGATSGRVSGPADVAGESGAGQGAQDLPDPVIGPIGRREPEWSEWVLRSKGRECQGEVGESGWRCCRE